MNYQKPRSTKNNNIYVDSTEGESDEDTPKCYQVANSNGVRKPATKAKSLGNTKVSSVEFSEDDHIYEMEPDPLYEDTEENGIDDGSIYENTEFPSQESLIRKMSSPAVMPSNKPPQLNLATRAHSLSEVQQAKQGKPHRAKPQRHSPDDYEDPDAMLDNIDAAENLDYVDMDSGSIHNTYIDPEDLRRVSTCSSATASSGSFTSNKRPDSTSSVPGASEC